MNSYWLVSTTLLTMMTASVASSALAQSFPGTATDKVQPNLSTNGPAGTYSRTQTHKTLDSAGTVRKTTSTFKKSQSYTNGNHQLSAKTVIKSTGPATTVTTNPDQESNMK